VIRCVCWLFGSFVCFYGGNFGSVFLFAISHLATSCNDRQAALCMPRWGVTPQVVFLLPPLKEVMFLLRSVCLSVRRITDKVANGFWRKFLGGVWPRDQWVKFWWRMTIRITIRIQESEIRIHWIIKKVTNGFWWNFMESWGVAWRPTAYILVTIHVTIQICEYIPDPERTAMLSTHTEQMPCKNHSAINSASVRQRSVLSEYFQLLIAAVIGTCCICWIYKC